MNLADQLRRFRAAVRAEAECYRALDAFQTGTQGIPWRSVRDTWIEASDASILCMKAFGVWSITDPMPAKQESRERVRGSIERWAMRAVNANYRISTSNRAA